MHREKIITLKEAKELLEFCQHSIVRGTHPDRAAIRAAVVEGLRPLIAQYDTPSGPEH